MLSCYKNLATQWIQSYPCKTKTSQEAQKSPMKFLEPTRKPKVIYTDNSLEFGRSCEELSWNHCTSTPHRSETRRILWNVTGVCEFKISCVMGRHLISGKQRDSFSGDGKAKLISGQTETTGISLINFQDLRMVSTSLLHSRAYQHSRKNGRQSS